MEKALSIPFIVQHIVANLHLCNWCDEAPMGEDYTYLEPDRSLADLLHCILVSKFWASVVIPILWNSHARLEDFVSVMHTIPFVESPYRHNLRAREVSHGTDQNAVTFGSPQLERWELYSSYVKTLRFRSGLSRPTLQLLEEAIRFVQDNDKIPQISTLIARGRDFFDPQPFTHRYIVITSLFTTSLERLQLEFHDDDLKNGDARVLQSFLDTLPTRCPGVRDLVINVPNFLDIVAYYTSSFVSPLRPIASLQQLRALSLPSAWVSSDVLRIFRELPMLEHLSLQPSSRIHKPSRNYRKFVPHEDSVPRNWFPSLKFLSLFDLNVTDTFIDEFPFKHGLLTLDIELIFDGPNRQLSERISQNFPHLEELSIRTQKCFNIGLFTFETVFPFTSFSKLTVLKVIGVILYNDELQRLLVSWPNLLDLTLEGPELRGLLFEHGAMNLVTREPYGPTLHILDVIAKQLPKLQELNITLWASSIQDLEHSSHSFETLRSFALLTSFCNFGQSGFDIHRAALYINSVLPIHCYTAVEYHSDESLSPAGSDKAVFLENYRMFNERLVEQVKSFVNIRIDECARFRNVGGQTNVY